MTVRQIVLDTETTGLDPARGHRIIEIGCLELLNRRPTERNFHVYLQPDREIDDGALQVHGISNEFLRDKPRFADVAEDLLEFLRDAELIIHNAPFDLGFLDAEFARLGADWAGMGSYCLVLDTLELARELHPGQRNSLDALCRRYGVDNSARTLHGALLDAEILADVYLLMTGGQASLTLEADVQEAQRAAAESARLAPRNRPVRVLSASAQELAAHEASLDGLDAALGRPCLWRRDSA